jgi:nitrite reductase/ring-hydroxylating ferredoxin subunit
MNGAKSRSQNRRGKIKEEGRAGMAEVLVCKEGELADGAVRLIKVGRVEVGVIRHKGEYYAYRNLCPHQGGPACEGKRMPQVVDRIGADGGYLGQTYDQDDMHIVCPWHGYEFHLSDGCHVIDRKLRLKKYDVRQRDGAIYLDI